eukprot:CAMPEP_0179004392 /NCGR_PEP_ID=MMETSP0795-20121207/13276_1 /TAXON_ID=88552 /ORGANISM="Amoebophrya sp., Strain Ameob2" /LENGTH=186 /DNA_ID=CAMNT_0020698643 /DNA_START=636 /DNA_END=1197 /DNA_ORIENTATION=+
MAQREVRPRLRFQGTLLRAAQEAPSRMPKLQAINAEARAGQQALTTAQSVPAKVRFLNEVPLASGCYYKAEVVKSAMKQFFIAVIDLAERGYDIELDLADVVIKVKNKNVEAVFSSGIRTSCAVPQKPGSTHASTKGMTLSQSWAKPDYSNAMSTYLERPKSREVQNLRVGTANLGVMGRDLTSCA